MSIFFMFAGLSCNYVPIVKTCGHVNLPRAQDGHEDVCLIKKKWSVWLLLQSESGKIAKTFYSFTN